MATCVYYSGCGSPASVFFKGRMFCINHAREIQNKLRKVISDKEAREKRSIPENEEIAINNQRSVQTQRGLTPIRGTRFVVTKAEVRRMIIPIEITVNQS